MANSQRYMIAGSIVGVLVATLVALILRPVIIALSVRNDIAKIRKGHFNEEQLRQWAVRHHGDMTLYQGEYYGRVYVTNRLLHLLHLAPLTIFDAEVEIVGNRPVQSSLSISNGQYGPKPSGGVTLIVIEYEPPEHSFPVHDSLVLRVRKGELLSVTYAVTAESSQQAMARVFEINVWCLARIGGCSPSQLAPSIWALPPTPITRPTE